MHALPALILLCATVALGLYLGVSFLRHIPRRPMLIGTHLLLGAGSVEGLVIALNADVRAQAPVGAAELAPAEPDRLAMLMTGLIVLALFTGLLRASIGQGSRSTATLTLAVHAGLALAGFGLAMIWLAQHFHRL